MLIACLSVNAQSAWGNGGPTKGYKGFADISYGFGSGDFSIGDHLSASTTHGYQINSCSMPRMLPFLSMLPLALLFLCVSLRIWKLAWVMPLTLSTDSIWPRQSV